MYGLNSIQLSCRLQLVWVWSNVLWLPQHGYTRLHQPGQVPPHRPSGLWSPAHHQVEDDDDDDDDDGAKNDT